MPYSTCQIGQTMSYRRASLSQACWLPNRATKCRILHVKKDQQYHIGARVCCRRAVRFPSGGRYVFECQSVHQSVRAAAALSVCLPAQYKPSIRAAAALSVCPPGRRKPSVVPSAHCPSPAVHLGTSRGSWQMPQTASSASAASGAVPAAPAAVAPLPEAEWITK
jgi:hypothetical protein